MSCWVRWSSPAPSPTRNLGRTDGMTDPTTDLLKAQLKQLRLPEMVQELEKLSREAAAANQNYEQFLLQLTEIELAARAANALATRIKNAGFPVLKDFDTEWRSSRRRS